MTAGLRLTTGAEFAERDAPATPVQLDRDEAAAKEIFPLAGRVDPEPWLGRRPCLPDMLPVIGPASRHEGLWFNFGHHHLGFTLTGFGLKKCRFTQTFRFQNLLPFELDG